MDQPEQMEYGVSKMAHPPVPQFQGELMECKGESRMNIASVPHFKPQLKECEGGSEIGSRPDSHFVVYPLDYHGETGSLLHLKKSVCSSIDKSGSFSLGVDALNIFMGDVSLSMCDSWQYVVDGWETSVREHLTGLTKVYTFDDKVRLERIGTEVKMTDMHGGFTDLNEALEIIHMEVHDAKQALVRVFLITDGENTTPADPEKILKKMRTYPGKICEVYLLGVCCSFPVQYSIQLRSRLHSGNANIPTLFWAKYENEILEQFCQIGNYVKEEHIVIELEVEGSLLPGWPMKKQFNAGEWVYIPISPEKLGTKLNVHVNGNLQKMGLCHEILDVVVFLEMVLPQWHAVIIQTKNKSGHVPETVLEDLAVIFNSLMQEPVAKPSDSSYGLKSLKERGVLKKSYVKSLKTLKMKFETLQHEIKNILTTQSFANELDLARSVLKTTIVTDSIKHEAKSLKLKGHQDSAFREDGKAFLEVLAQVKEKICEIPVVPEETCKITMTSTINDLQDEDFPELIENLSKYEFLKTFTITGLPVLAPQRNASLLNPWTFVIKKILVSPYSIMSQVAIEQYAEMGIGRVGDRNKEVQLKADDDNTKYNAVVPVFSPAAAKVMGPILNTKLYAMCATFAILKNPYIIDHNIHMASLAAAWVKTISDFGITNRPRHAGDRLELIYVTASTYLKRPSYQHYTKALFSSPALALMSESDREYEGRMLKCESILKPMFIISLTLKENPDVVDREKLLSIIRLVVSEFVGRCLTHFTPGQLGYFDFFIEKFDWQDKETWAQSYSQKSIQDIVSSETDLASRYYYPQQMFKHYKSIIRTKLQAIKNELMSHIPVKVVMSKVSKLRSIANCGDVDWCKLVQWAEELGLSQTEQEQVFGESSVIQYIYHALTYRNSRDRLNNPMFSAEECLEKVKEKVGKEVQWSVRNTFLNDVKESLLQFWREDYKQKHSSVVMPMTRAEIVAKAAECGIPVTDMTFDKVYLRYNAQKGLLQNACQNPGCSFFLKPNRSFNEHISAGRNVDGFPHTFHKVAQECCTDSKAHILTTIQNQCLSRSFKQPKKLGNLEQGLKDSLFDLSKFYQTFSNGNT